MARERVWVVPPDPQTVSYDEHGGAIPGTGVVDPDTVAQAMADAGNTLLTVGGVLNVAPVRRQAPGPLANVYETHAVVFTWEGFVPAVEAPSTEEVEAMVEEVPEPSPEEMAEAEEEEVVNEDMSVADPQPVGG